AQEEPKPHSRLDAETIPHLDGLEADIVGVLEHRYDAAAVEADVELAGDAVKRAVVEDVEVPFARIRARVDQLLGSMPAVGVPVTLRMLSAPEPREHRPRSWIASIMATAFCGSTSRICRLARVVTWA